jgi:signal transduction histidine kinase
MKNLKAHHHLAIVSMLLFGVVAVWGWGTLVFASTSGTTVEVYVGPPDTCSNIPGYQTSVPAGMQVDGSGNCFTPPPPPTDMCNNMSGNQETVPAGYYQDASGACQPQPTPPKPPKDVCPNISGTQETVPAGYIQKADGSCVLPPKDLCSNIDGTQAIVPEGMERADDGTCFTPVPPVIPPAAPTEKPNDPKNPWVAPTRPRNPHAVDGTSDLKNIPAALDSTVAPLVNAIPEDVKQALRSVPPVVARTFPYFTFAVLGVAAAVMGWQAVNEVVATRKLMAIIKRERDVAEEKDNFISLASHYLRTPLTIMKGAIDTSRAVNELTEESAAPLQTAIAGLDNQIGVILNDVESNAALKKIAPPKEESPDKTNFFRSAFFWIPVVVTIVIAWLSNFLLGVVGEVELGAYNLIAQGGIYIAASILFYSAIRTRYIKQRERAYRETLLKHEHAIDSARNDFIDQASTALSAGLISIAEHKTLMNGLKTESFFKDGYDRFDNLLNKFNLLSQIQAGVIGATEKFDIKRAIDDIIGFYKPQLDARQLTVVNNIQNADITQRRSLFDFVLGSLIDNAIKFSNEGGTIQISSNPGEASLTVSVTDHGVGIPEEKMSQLFKPFSRGTSAMEFNYEGLGFSLFLDKIIMDYVGGHIAAESNANQNTTFSVTTSTG